jgi:hypothetical protein
MTSVDGLRPPAPVSSIPRAILFPETFLGKSLQRGTGKPPPFSRRPPLPLDLEESRGLREAPPRVPLANDLARTPPPPLQVMLLQDVSPPVELEAAGELEGGARRTRSPCTCTSPHPEEEDGLRQCVASVAHPSRREAAGGLGSAAQGGRPPTSSSRWLGGAGEGEELRPPPPHPPARRHDSPRHRHWRRVHPRPCSTRLTWPCSTLPRLTVLHSACRRLRCRCGAPRDPAARAAATGVCTSTRVWPSQGSVAVSRRPCSTVRRCLRRSSERRGDLHTRARAPKFPFVEG